MNHEAGTITHPGINAAVDRLWQNYHRMKGRRRPHVIAATVKKKPKLVLVVDNTKRGRSVRPPARCPKGHPDLS